MLWPTRAEELLAIPEHSSPSCGRGQSTAGRVGDDLCEISSHVTLMERFGLQPLCDQMLTLMFEVLCGYVLKNPMTRSRTRRMMSNLARPFSAGGDKAFQLEWWYIVFPHGDVSGLTDSLARNRLGS